MILFFASTTAPFGSQCHVARRAKPALGCGSLALDLRPRAWAARAAHSNGVAVGAAGVGKELVALLCAIQIGRVGDLMSPEQGEGVYLQVSHD